LSLEILGECRKLHTAELSHIEIHKTLFKYLPRSSTHHICYAMILFTSDVKILHPVSDNLSSTNSKIKIKITSYTVSDVHSHR
jgi:hypothetical protein